MFFLKCNDNSGKKQFAKKSGANVDEAYQTITDVFNGKNSFLKTCFLAIVKFAFSATTTP